MRLAGPNRPSGPANASLTRVPSAPPTKSASEPGHQVSPLRTSVARPLIHGLS